MHQRAAQQARAPPHLQVWRLAAVCQARRGVVVLVLNPLIILIILHTSNSGRLLRELTVPTPSMA
jgi:hypothetical protein